MNCTFRFDGAVSWQSGAGDNCPRVDIGVDIVGRTVVLCVRPNQVCLRPNAFRPKALHQRCTCVITFVDIVREGLPGPRYEAYGARCLLVRGGSGFHGQSSRGPGRLTS